MKPKDTLNDSVNSDLSDFQINDEYLEENSVTPPHKNILLNLLINNSSF